MKLLRITFKTIAYTLLLLVVLLAAVVIGLRLPSVQTEVVQRAAVYLSEKLGMPVQVGGVRISWFNRLILDDVRIADDRQRPMIEVGQLAVDFNVKRLTDSTQMLIDYVQLRRPNVHLVRYPGTRHLNIDEFIERINKLTASTDTTQKGGKPLPFKIGRAEITNGTLSFDDNRKRPFNEKGYFDYNHFKIQELGAELTDFLLFADTVAFRADNLRGFEKLAQLRIHELDTKFLYSAEQLRLGELLAKINQTTIRNHLELRYTSAADLSEFNTKVRIKADFDSSIVFTDDIARFATAMYQYKDRYVLNGQFDGTVVDFKLNNANLKFGKNSRLKGSYAFKGLPNIKQTVMNFVAQQTVINPADLRPYLGSETTQRLERFGTVLFEGTFDGLYNDFSTKGSLRSDLGLAVTDLSMKLNDNSAKSSYKGNLSLEDFDLGKLAGDTKLFQKIQMSGKIEGQGFALDNAVLRLDGTIQSIGLMGYSYKSTYVDGKMQKGLFDGRVSIKDTNLRFDLAGTVDLRKPKEELFRLNGQLHKANLKQLGITQEEMRLQTNLNVYFSGTNADDIRGTGKFLDTYLSQGQRNLIIDSLFVYSFQNINGRQIGVESDLLVATVKGDFQVSQTVRDLDRLVEEYKLYFLGNERDRQEYYERKLSVPQRKYSLEYRLLLKNATPLMAFLYPEGYISPNAELDGVFSMGNTSAFNVTGKADTLVVNENKFFKSTFDLTTSKFANSAEVLASALITSDKQQISSIAPTEKLDMEASWDETKIAFSSRIRQQKSTNRANLNGSLRFVPDGIELSFRRSKFRLLDDEWNVSPDNLVTVSNRDICFKDLVVSNKGQSLSLNGVISPDSAQSIVLKTKDFRLQTIAPVLQTDLRGTVNGVASLRDLYKNLNVDSEVQIDELYYDKFLIGNIFGDGKWDKVKKQLNVDSHIDRMGNRIMSLKGYYDPNREENSLNLLANLNQTNLEILEPFTKGIVRDLSGTATGKINISGTPTNPILAGEMDIRKGRLMFEYMKTVWNFEDKITFEEDAIRAKKLLMTDDEGNKATLSGGVYHDGFKYFLMQLDADLKNFKVLNTSIKDNETFYGSAYVTGHVDIDGPPENININADVKSNRGTRIYIPLDGAQKVATDDFVEFVNLATLKQDSTKVPPVVDQVKLSGITMNFNFDITPEAYCEIQLDRQSGDIIKAYGHSKLNVKVDTKGDFTMTGNYELDRGEYTFTFENILNKRFQIRPGSRISWSGNPYEAMLDVKAAYTQYTSLKTILTIDSLEARKPEYNRKYPVNVVMQLSEKLMSPRIGYTLEIKDYPQLPTFNTGVTAFLNKIQTDEQELARQISSMLALGQLIPQNPTQQFAQSNIMNNLTELFSNQLSKWASQLDKNLEVDLSLNGGLNQDLMKNLQLRFSYNFNDRLRITRNGGFTNAQNQTDANTLIGDWSLEWLITPDGRLRLKGYNRNIQNPFFSLTNSAVTTTMAGASVIYTQSFNYFFKKKRNQQQVGIGLRDNDEPALQE